MNSIIWPYLCLICSIGYFILSMASVSILINQENVGWLMATVTSGMYPFFLVCILSVWTTVGETFTSNVWDGSRNSKSLNGPQLFMIAGAVCGRRPVLLQLGRGPL